MIRLLVDQNFNERILDGITRRSAMVEYIHVRDVGLATARDGEVLEWAAREGRVVLTHDRRTVPPIAQSRIAAGLAMPCVFVVSTEMSIGQAIDELIIAACCMEPDECNNVVRFFPF